MEVSNETSDITSASKTPRLVSGNRLGESRFFFLCGHVMGKDKGKEKRNLRTNTQLLTSKLLVRGVIWSGLGTTTAALLSFFGKF